MNPAIKGTRVFYGWWIIIAAMAILFVQAGTGFYSFGVILKPLMNEFGWSRGLVSMAQSIYLLTAGVGGLFIAKLTRRYSIKKIVLLGAVMGGIGFILLSLTTNLWYLYALYLFQGFGLGAGAGLIPTSVLISNWFTKRRGTAMGIATAGIALGAMVLVPLEGFITASFGWRQTYIFMGLVVLAIDIPAALFVLRTSPQEMGLMPDGNKPSEMKESPVREVPINHAAELAGNSEPSTTAIWIRSLPVWLLSLSFTLAQIGEISILIHEIPLITDLGISVTAAAAALAFTGGMGGIGKIAFGWLTDKLSTRYVTVLCFALQMVGVFILMQTHNMTMVWIFVVVFGFAMGGMATLMPLAIGDLFGIARFGVIYGFVHFVVIGGSTLGPTFAGFIFDATGSYSLVLTIFSIMYGISIIVAYFTWGSDPRPIMSPRR